MKKKRRLWTMLLALLSLGACQERSQSALERERETAAPPNGIPLMEAGTTKIADARARWISRDSIVWNVPGDTACTFKLYRHPTGEILRGLNGIELGAGGVSYTLPLRGVVGDGSDSPADQKLAALSHLDGWARINAAGLHEIAGDLVREHLVIAVEDERGKLRDATSVQTAGILDDLYAYRGKLGLEFAGDRPSFKLWAPTARSAQLHVYENAGNELPGGPLTMERLLQDGRWTGVWQATGMPEWQGLFYLYEVEVFVRTTAKVERNMVTDPYSVSLSANSRHSQIIDLDRADLKPPGWGTLIKPHLEAVEDIVLYELHVRDFSAFDAGIPEQLRGTFAAFAHRDSLGMKHLKSLADAGLTHVHLLPAFDIGTIEEERSRQKRPEVPLAPADSPRQQEAAVAAAGGDAYNWGYDPFHYLVPEGSYATDPGGSRRILEFRAMIDALNEIGLRVVMDVVFNHTCAAGQDQNSVLDRIVPGYYYRLDDAGAVQSSSCCPDTASEHAMMEKLMIDALLLWVRQYKVDGFRFDLMGHHTRGNMRRVREALDLLTLEKDGVDGPKLYVYGEGWKFGSLDAILPDEACHQLNTHGSGIGTFNDRLRDSVRGGNPFASLSTQGFATGLYFDFNKDPGNREVPADPAAQKTMLLEHTDLIRLGMAGNLRDFRLQNAEGRMVKGAEIHYRGQPNAGYAKEPRETVNYVSAHDNHTLWDAIAAKAPFHTTGRSPATATVEERLAMHKLALSIVALGQGIPFFHAGCEMLRSKSGDADSYNSGDHFNRLDFTFRDNNWGAGLPPAEKNRNAWGFWGPRLADPSLKPAPAHMMSAAEHFRTMLRVRRSSPLFRLRSAEEIGKRVRFLDAEQGPLHVGLIVMAIGDDLPGEKDLDPNCRMAIIIINAAPAAVKFRHDTLRGKKLELHPAMVDGVFAFDRATGAIDIPPRSTVVYMER